ncbi:hypothetical protein A5821_002517 [Enterococcus sp. 7F3_DIV0205]|uniref:Uncharacterized protein n=2 Tax=Candidatus Enterococcus palustris TaxID=1834189 RepID=A0AAQ3W9U4_9ENTE|nr:hypothetical protein [Enterococcus sp. 7F3_DIV0205]
MVGNIKKSSIYCMIDSCSQKTSVSSEALKTNSFFEEKKNQYVLIEIKKKQRIDEVVMVQPIETTQTQNKFIYLFVGLALAATALYVSKFYLFYQDAYFYIDKSRTLFYQIISFLNDNWIESLMYLSLSFLVYVALFFFSTIGHFFKKNHKEQRLYYFFYGVSILTVVASFFTILWPIFLVIIVLSMSVVYIIFVLSFTMAKKTANDEERDLLEIIGPFQTETEAEERAQVFIHDFFEKKSLVAEKEIYLDENNHYYVELFYHMDVPHQSSKEKQ